MARDGCNFCFSFLSIFCPFKNCLKTENFKKMKTRLEITSFYTSVPKIMIKCYIVPETWCMTDIIVIFHLGLSPPHTHTHTLTHNFKKMKTKTSGRCYTVPEIWCMTDVIAIFHFGLFFALLPP